MHYMQVWVFFHSISSSTARPLNVMRVLNLAHYDLIRNSKLYRNCADVHRIFVHGKNFVDWSKKLRSKGSVGCLPRRVPEVIDDNSWRRWISNHFTESSSEAENPRSLALLCNGVRKVYVDIIVFRIYESTQP